MSMNETQSITAENTELDGIKNGADVQKCTFDKEESEKEQGGERLFTRQELEDAVKQRLTRERKKNESLMLVKQIISDASKKGLLKGTSYAEMAKEIIEKLSDDGQAKDTSAPASETPSVADGDGEVYAENGGENTKVEENTDEKQDFVTVLGAIKAKYSPNVLSRVLSGDSFERFAKGKKGSTTEIFDEYCSFLSSLEESADFAKEKSGHSRLASTGFSVHSGVPSAGTSLTKQQMEIARSAGMSYGEYENLLASIPVKTGRNI